MNERKFYFKTTRKWKGFDNDLVFAFYVFAPNIIGASQKAWTRLRGSIDSIIVANSDWPGQYQRIDNIEYDGVYMVDDNKLICGYTDIELINEQEYESLDPSAIKDFV